MAPVALIQFRVMKTTQGYGHFEITYVETYGLHYEVGVPQLFCRFAAIEIAQSHPFTNANILLLARGEDGWKSYERKLEPDDYAGLVSPLEARGIPPAALRIEGDAATQDWWTWYQLTIRSHEQTSVVKVVGDISGEDADVFHALRKGLFALAGYKS